MNGVSILSVGIDIGTSTTSMVLSRIQMRNTASGFSVPQVCIVGSEIIYKSEIYTTPLVDGILIDTEKIRAILEKEYDKAGITPSMIQTGAVIITGESARKQNASLVTQTLSSFAGDFVVATAGPDLESVIAAKGAGAQQYSKEHSCVVANLDIGGGTTNIAVFHCGELCAKGCWDIGGRLVQVDRQKKVTYLSPRLPAIMKAAGVSLELGRTADWQELDRLCRVLAQVLEDTLKFTASKLCEEMRTAGSSRLTLSRPVEYITFSGGVADCVYSPQEDWFRFGDIGPILAHSIRESSLMRDYQVIPPKETIRATVVGAGSYTTSVSGSTITYTDESVFPVKNLPAFLLGRETEHQCLTGNDRNLREETEWFLEQNDCDNLLFCIQDIDSLSYRQLNLLADALCHTADSALGKEQTVMVLCRGDFAKALGQAMQRRLLDRKLVCIDSISVQFGDYIDIGRPLMNGMAVPVVVKTLLYG